MRRAANVKADKGFRHKTDDPNYFIICRMGTTAIDICGRQPIWKKTSTETETINCSENAVGSNVQSQAGSQSVSQFASGRLLYYTYIIILHLYPQHIIISSTLFPSWLCIVNSNSNKNTRTVPAKEGSPGHNLRAHSSMDLFVRLVRCDQPNYN